MNVEERNIGVERMAGGNCAFDVTGLANDFKVGAAGFQFTTHSCAHECVIINDQNPDRHDGVLLREVRLFQCSCGHGEVNFCSTGKMADRGFPACAFHAAND